MNEVIYSHSVVTTDAHQSLAGFLAKKKRQYTDFTLTFTVPWAGVTWRLTSIFTLSLRFAAQLFKSVTGWCACDDSKNEYHHAVLKGRSIWLSLVWIINLAVGSSDLFKDLSCMSSKKYFFEVKPKNLCLTSSDWGPHVRTRPRHKAFNFNISFFSHGDEVDLKVPKCNSTERWSTVFYQMSCFLYTVIVTTNFCKTSTA